MSLSRTFFSRLVPIFCVSLAMVANLFASPPDRFAVEDVVTNLQQPISMRFLPDGRLLVVQKKGPIRIVDVTTTPGTSELYMDLGDPAFASGLESTQERGVLDIAVDPNFPTEPYIYVFFTPKNDPTGPRSRVSRFTHVENAGGMSSRGDLTSEVVLWKETQGYDSCCHFGGGLDFGPDGYLWLTTGDHFQGSYAEDLTKAGGKVHRFAKDGSIPATNPYVDGPGGLVDSIVAYGLRNPFRARWDLEDNRFYVAEVGGNTQSTAWEDLHVIDYDPISGQIVDEDFGTPEDNFQYDGINFGWPTVEGLPPHNDWPAADIDEVVGEPIFAWRHNGETTAINGGVVYRGNQFPEEYQGAYFFADSTRDFVRYIKFDENGQLAVNPDPDPITSKNPDSLSYTFDLNPVGRVVSIEMGPDDSLYFVSFTDSGGAYGENNPSVLGAVRRYVYDGGNPRPVISQFEPDVAEGPSPHSVEFTLAAADPQGESMTYYIDFGDGNVSPTLPLLANTPAYVSHTYLEDGPYTPTAYVSDGNKAGSATTEVRAGTPPVVDSIVSYNPRPGSIEGMFRFGDTISFSATASDAEDGALDGDNFTWNVTFVRPGNTHPSQGPDEGVESVDFTIPSQGQGFSGPVLYRAQVDVTDSSGLMSTATIDILPEKADIYFETVPSGIVVQVNGNTSVTAPFVLDTLVNWDHTITVPQSVCHEGRLYVFDSWSNGVTSNQQILVMPDHDITLTANYTDMGPCIEAPGDAVLRLTTDAGLVTAGDFVLSWEDQSPSFNHLTAPDTNTAPTLVENVIGGYDAVQFDGVDDVLENSFFADLPTGSADRTMVLIARFDDMPTTTGWAGFAYGKPQTNKTFGLALTDSGEIGVQAWGSGNDYLSDYQPEIGGGFQVLTAVVEAGEMSFYANGVLIGGFEHTYATSSGAVALGEELNGFENAAITVLEATIYDRALSFSELGQLGNYANQRYGIANGTDYAPELEITSLLDGETVAQGELVSFSAIAEDFEDGNLDAQIEWTSDLDGFLGTGAALDLTLTLGSHVVTASVVDSNGSLVTESFTIHITESGDAFPTVVISDPLSGSVYQTGNEVFFTAAATDPEDGDVSAAIVWTSSLDGQIGTGASVSSDTLSEGQHQITASVSDTLGQSDVDSITITVSQQSFGAIPTEGLVLQLESDLNVSLQAGTQVAAWLDQSGMGNDLDAIGAPELITGGTPTGLPSISFDGVDDAFRRVHAVDQLGGFPSGNSDRTLFFVVKYETGNAWAGFSYGRGASNKAFGLISKQPSGELVLQGWGGSNDSVSNVVGNGAGWLVQSVTLDGGTGTMYKDGAPVVVFNHTYDTQLSQLSIAEEIAGYGNVQLETAAVLLYDRALSPEEREEVDAYLLSKYISASGNQAPQVEISSPADLSSYEEGANIDFAASASDAEDGDVSADVVWTSDLDGQIGTGAQFSSSALSVGQHTVTASVIDSASASASDSVTITVYEPAGNTAPSVLVSTPADNSEFESEVEISFQAAASDAEDGDLSSSISWSSDVDGALGTGAEILVDDLTVGVHVVTAHVADGEGLDSVDSVTVTIVEPIDNYAPVVEILAPSEGEIFAPGALVELSASASDVEDGDLSASISWSSDLDGVLGTGATLTTSSLSEGNHTLTASVEDSGDPALEGVATVAIVVGEFQELPVLSGLTLRFESDQGLVANAGEVSQWQDASGSANDVFASGAPVLLPSATPSGLPAVSFDGVDDQLVRNSSSNTITGLPQGNADRTVFMVANYEGGSAWAGFSYGSGSRNKAFGLAARQPTGELVLQGWGSGNDLVSSSVANGEGWLIQSGQVTGGEGAMFRDGVEVARFSHTYQTGGSRIILGAEIAGYGFMDMDIAAILVYNRALSPEEMEAVNSYLSGKYLELAGPPNEIPTLSLTAPASDVTVDEGDSVDFAATASDVEDGDLSSAIIWTSDLDGELGVGATLTVSDLSVGEHVVSALVTDSRGAEAADSVTVTVEGNFAPSITIIAPVEGATALEGEFVSFEGSASDPEDGDLAASIEWVSDLDGPLGTGALLDTSALSVGEHEVTASVEDSLGEVALATVTVRVLSGDFVSDGLVLHLESDQGVVLGTGQTVDGWVDLSDSANDLFAAGDPQLVASSTPTGQAAIAFDGSGDKLERTASISGLSDLPSGSANRSIFAVIKYNGGNAWAGVSYGKGASNKAFGLAASQPAGKLVLQGWGSGNDLMSNVAVNGTGWLVQSGVVEAGLNQLFKDGVLIAETNHNYATTVERLVIGQEIANLGYVDIEVAAVLVYDRALSDEEQAIVEGYLQSKYVQP